MSELIEQGSTQSSTTEPSNPLLAKLRLPGETYRLPSRGLFYEPGVLDSSVKNGELEVYPMTAMDEIILSTPDKLLSGKAIMEVFSRCIPQIKQPENLLSKDVDFLMVCLRAATFGPLMEVSYTHDCKGAKPHTYQVELQKMINQARQVDPTTISSTFFVSMSNGQKVTLTPMTFGNVMGLYQNTAMMKSENEITTEDANVLILTTITNIIKSVDDITDKKHIMEWVGGIPISWKRLIEKTAQESSAWGVDFKVDQTCLDCKQEIKIEITANPISFFS